MQTILVIDDDESLRDTIGVMLEQELAAATAFSVEAVVPARMKNAPQPMPVPMGRPELAAMALDSPGAVAAHDEHDDE